jgi:uncharacterized membrane protein
MAPRGKCILSVLITLLMCSTVLAPAASGTHEVKARTLATPDGLTWSDDIRVTQDPSPDVNPQLVSDSLQDTDIIWTKGTDLNYTKLDYRGQPLIKQGSFINEVFPTQHSGQYGYALARGGSDDSHLLFKNPGSGFNPVLYQRFGPDWKSRFLSVDTAFGLTLSTGATLGVSSSSIAYVIYDYFPPGGDERVGLTIVDKDGNILKQAVDLSEPAWYVDGSTMIIDHNDSIRLLANVWYGADQGMWALTADKYGVRPVTVPPQHLYSTGAYSFPPMPKMAACPDNNVHLLISSSQSGGGTLTYMKLDKDNKPIIGAVAPVNITSTASDYGDIQCDSQNNVYIIWADSVDGNIYYEMLAPGTEGKAHTPIKLVSSHQAKSPKMSIDPLDGVHVVWVDVRDGNDEIYFKFAFGYGVELGMTGEDLSKIMFIHPSQTNSANMTVENLGGFNDTIWLNLSIDYNGHEGVGWNASLDYYELELGPQAIYENRIDIRGPSTGKLNDYIIVNVNATSKGNPWKIDNLTFRVYLVIKCKIVIGIPDNVHITNAGQSSEYRFYVKNAGDVVTNVTLNVDYPDQDWNATISPSFISLMKPYTTMSVSLTVTAPKDAFANTLGTVVVVGTCDCDPELRATAISHTMVAPSVFLSMSIDNDEKYVDPGNSTEFNITVKNEGNMPGTIAIVVEIVSGTGDWYAALDHTSVGLMANTQEIIRLTVQPPDNAPANSRLTIKVGGWNDARTHKNEVQATTIVNPVHKLDIRPAAKAESAMPGGAAHFSLSVTNTGNIEELLDLSTLGLPQGWIPRFIKNGIEGFNVRIPQGAKSELELEVQVPIDTLSRAYDFELLLQDETNTNWTLSLSVIVDRYFYLELTVVDAKARGGPAGTAVFDIYVRNRGNSEELINLSTEGLPVGWKAQFVVNSNNTSVIDLKAGQQGRVSLVVGIPLEVSGHSIVFQALGTFSSGIRGSVDLFIDVEQVDLQALRVTLYPANPEKGEPVTIKFLTRNVGIIEYANVEVRLFENGQLISSQTIGKFPGGADKEVVFTWVPIRNGPTKLKFVIDPLNKISETNERNNELSLDLIIRAAKSTPTPGFEPVLVAMTLVIVTIVASSRRRLRGETL